MIEIYNKKELIPSDRTLIDDVEVFFPMMVHSRYFTEQDIAILQAIDKAILLDKETQAIKTPFGITSLNNVSSGCKAALIYSALLQNEDTWGKEFALDITECGSNALNEIFSIAQDTEINIPFVLRHTDIAEVKEFDFLFNGVMRGRDLYEL